MIEEELEEQLQGDELFEHKQKQKQKKRCDACPRARVLNRAASNLGGGQGRVLGFHRGHPAADVVWRAEEARYASTSRRRLSRGWRIAGHTIPPPSEQARALAAGASGTHARCCWKKTKARAAEAATAASSAKARPTAAPTAGVARRQRPRRAVTTRTVARCTKTCTAVAGIIWCPATSPAFHPEPCVVGRLSPASKGASYATLAQATRLIEIWTIKRQMDCGGLWRAMLSRSRSRIAEWTTLVCALLRGENLLCQIWPATRAPSSSS